MNAKDLNERYKKAFGIEEEKKAIEVEEVLDEMEVFDGTP